MAEDSHIVEIESSPGKLLGLCGLGVFMAAGSALVAARIDGDPDLFTQIICGFGAVFFSLCTVVAVWRLMRMRGTVVTITPDGIRDIRIASEFIPWSAVRKISTWEYAGQKAMVLAVDPAVEKQLGVAAMARWTRGASRALGVDGLCIAAQGLKIDYPTLFKLASEHVRP